ncbi:MAG: ATP-binding protein [Succinimonas sp.]|nr:ATP-binding protein [Succinimonas sp.]
MARNKDCGQLLAIPANIHTLLSGSAIEWERIEFRESWQPEDSLKTITAFASDIGSRGGGYIVIGVADDNGRPKFPPKGLSPAEIAEIRQDVLRKCKLIEPDYLPVVAPADYDDHTRLICCLVSRRG